MICELKAVNEMNPVYEAQVLTHMKLSDKRLGFLINFMFHLSRTELKELFYKLILARSMKDFFVTS